MLQRRSSRTDAASERVRVHETPSVSTSPQKPPARSAMAYISGSRSASSATSGQPGVQFLGAEAHSFPFFCPQLRRPHRAARTPSPPPQTGKSTRGAPPRTAVDHGGQRACSIGLPHMYSVLFARRGRRGADGSWRSRGRRGATSTRHGGAARQSDRDP